MGRFFLNYLSGESVYCCSSCHTQLANSEEVLSKAFQGRGGKAYLFASVVNICSGELEDRVFNSGEYTVRDIICLVCLNVIGWKYEVSKEESQKWKVGKFIIEKQKMVKVSAS
eukprot:TRINITY_DN703_c0_g1_i2.p1 TRINITY_DN703_c0_g1~~TRINITY_DN703_c0_g1_i2.p1  ORF type:complete len:113 (+),score=8.41 TRINITY_DN703_c0_g1_i2:160-498(+)